MQPASHALIAIDIQNDFCPGGALAVADGDQIIPAVNAMMDDFAITVLTQDWHPANHTSFAANRPGTEPMQVIEMPYGPQVLWPVHCVQGSHGGEFHGKLRTDPADMIIRKGYRPEIDSYSAFFENDHQTPTGLHGYLQTRGVTALTMVGLATDFCVAFSAVDAAGLGYDVTVHQAACRAIDHAGSLAEARDRMRAAGVKLA